MTNTKPNQKGPNADVTAVLAASKHGTVKSTGSDKSDYDDDAPDIPSPDKEALDKAESELIALRSELAQVTARADAAMETALATPDPKEPALSQLMSNKVQPDPVPISGQVQRTPEQDAMTDRYWVTGDPDGNGGRYQMHPSGGRGR